MKSFPKNNNYRSKKLMDFTKEQACIVRKQHCDYGPAGVAHHTKLLGEGGTGIKPPDTHIVPLSDPYHTLLHAMGEKRFEEKYKVDLKKEVINNLTEFIKEKT